MQRLRMSSNMSARITANTAVCMVAVIVFGISCDCAMAFGHIRQRRQSAQYSVVARGSAILCQEGFDFRLFPKAGFSPSQVDPFLVLLNWSRVQHQLQALFCDDRPILSLHFRQFAPIGGNGQLRIVFGAQSPRVVAALVCILGVDEGMFDHGLKPVYETKTYEIGDFAEEFRRNNRPDTLQIVKGLQWYLNPPKDEFAAKVAQIGGKVSLLPATRSEQALRMISHWQEFYEDKSGLYRLSWRVNVSLTPESDGAWNFLAKVEVGKRSKRQSYDEIEAMTDSRKLGNTMVPPRPFVAGRGVKTRQYTVAHNVPASEADEGQFHDGPAEQLQVIQQMGDGLFMSTSFLMSVGRERFKPTQAPSTP
jgi:hypothetical protein